MVLSNHVGQGVQLKYFVFRLGGAMIFNNETALEFRFYNSPYFYISIIVALLTGSDDCHEILQRAPIYKVGWDSNSMTMF